MNRQHGLLVLVQFGWVDIDMNDLAMLGKLAELSGHPVIEANTKGEKQIGFIDGVVGIDGAVHAKHVEAEVMIVWETTQAQQGHRDRDSSLFSKGAKAVGGTRLHHAPTSINDRPG